MAKDKAKRSWKRWVLLLVNVLVLVALALFGGYYFKKYQDLKNHPIPADQAVKSQIERYKASVSKLYATLPTDEEPTVYTVTDKEKLKDQAFFAKAENEDVSLIYPNAKLAILYRPSTNQIINVSTVNIQSTVKVKVIGPDIARKAATKILDEQYKTTVTYEEGSESKTEAGTTLVADLSGKNADLVQRLATSLDGEVGNLPEGEEKPEGVDIVIIVVPVQ